MRPDAIWQCFVDDHMPYQNTEIILQIDCETLSSYGIIQIVLVSMASMSASSAPNNLDQNITSINNVILLFFKLNFKPWLIPNIILKC